MSFSLVGTNIVILAKTHNPSIISTEWLVQKGIIDDEVINFTHTPLLSLTETQNFTLIVDPERLQIQVKNASNENTDALPGIVKEYISKLPETPYTAIGFNYLYNVPIGQPGLKSVLSPDESKLSTIFSGWYGLGAIVCFKFQDFAARMSVNPSPDDDQSATADFNFHLDSKDFEKIKGTLGLYGEAKAVVEQVLRGLFGG